MKKMLVAISVVVAAGLCGCGSGGQSAALNQVLPGATMSHGRTTASLPSGTRVYNVSVVSIRTLDGKYSIIAPTASIMSQSETSVSFQLGDGSVKTVDNVTVTPARDARMTVSLKPGVPVPPALANQAPSYVVP
jgi:hypothetical protein